MQGSELSEILRQAVAEGKKDSSGHFTLDANRTGKKLAHFELPSPAAYLLRWVQAAAGCETRYLQFFLRRGQLLMVATLNQPTPFQADDLWSRLDAPSLGRKPVDHLCAGLRACALRKPDTTRVFLFDSQELLTGDRSGWRIERLSQPGSFRQWLGYDCGFAVQMEWKWWLFAPRLADEHQILWQSCCFAPFQILLDNTEVSDTGYYATRCPQAIHYGCDSRAHLPAPAPTSFRSKNTAELTRELCKHWIEGPPATHSLRFRKEACLRVGWVAYIPTGNFVYKYEAGIFPIVGGVTAEPLRLQGLRMGTVVLLDADDLETDLSGLKVIENDRLRERLQEIQGHLGRWEKFQEDSYTGTLPFRKYS